MCTQIEDESSLSQLHWSSSCDCGFISNLATQREDRNHRQEHVPIPRFLCWSKIFITSQEAFQSYLVGKIVRLLGSKPAILQSKQPCLLK